MKNLLKILSLLTITGFILTACEGPMGPQGPAGTNGTNGTNGEDGVDANETCKLCHNTTTVEAIAIEYHYSLHATGEAYEEGTRNACAPCHSHQGFLNVVSKNTPATFAGPDANNKYTNNYVAEASVLGLPGGISCFTCHSSLHTDYEGTEFSPLATTAAIPMTMWGGAKSINFTNANGNLCGKCHQPRPVTGSNGNVIDYAKLISEPTTTYTLSSVGYRTGVHYGTQAAMASGMGGIEFGTAADYSNSAHVAGASCTTCHMAEPTALAGGHSFKAAGNFKGCNTTGCHTTMSATNATFTATQTEIDGLLEDLAAKINALGGGNDILMMEADGEYHGYFNIYDAGSNPTGYWKTGTATPTLPALTNAQFGAILNYQLAYRDGSRGVHNAPYIKTLLTNTLAAW